MSLTIGQRLRNAREERYLTLEKASEETRIRVVLLQALESDDYSVMPSAAQGRGFLRNYSEYLHIDIDEVISELQKNGPPLQEMSGPLPQINLLETDIPPLTDSLEEKKAPPFWMLRPFDTDSPLRAALRSAQAWFARRQKTESGPQTESTDPVQDRFLQSDEGVEVKVEEQSLPVEAEQVEVKGEPKPNLFARLISLFRVRLDRSESVSTPEIDEAGGPVPAPETKQSMPVESPDVIFAQIGRKLRERRELISLTVEEVERHTRLRAALVKAMEEGAFGKLPSTVQTRGMLANYAAFLDLDADVILLRFADALQARHREKYSETPREKIQTEVITSMPLFRSFIAGDLIFGVVMIVLILSLSVWGIGRVLNSQEQEFTQATAPSIVDVLAGTALPTLSLDATLAPAGDAPIPGIGETTIEAPTFGPNVNVVVTIFAVERTFMRISVDGEIVFEGRIAPRETQVYEAENQVEILTGNAAALRITYNGRDLGLMGNIGQVVSQVYTITGVATPTATLPPTPTQTLPVTITLTPTRTPTPTVQNTTAP